MQVGGIELMKLGQKMRGGFGRRISAQRPGGVKLHAVAGGKQHPFGIRKTGVIGIENLPERIAGRGQLFAHGQRRRTVI